MVGPNVKAELTLLSTAVKADLDDAQRRDGNGAWHPASRATDEHALSRTTLP